LRQLPRKAIAKLTYIYNAAFRLKYVPSYWKTAEVIMIQKPGKPATEAASYRPISLLAVLSKLLKKLVLKRFKTILDEKQIISTHQSGFRIKHSTIHQVHRITTVIENTLEEKKVCPTIFLDVAQAFDKVWHEGLFHKIEQFLQQNTANC
jgi:hypothetical protein